MQKFHFSIETATGIEIVKAFENKQFHKKSRSVEQTGYYIIAISLVDTVHHLFQFTIEHQ